MRPHHGEYMTITRVRELNHDAHRMVNKIKALEEPEEGFFSRPYSCEL